jgi:hypothetical protein
VRFVLLAWLAGCQSSPDCADVVDHVIAVKQSISKASGPEWERTQKVWRHEMMPFCRDKLTDDDRRCMLAIQNMDDLRKCEEPIKARH